MHTSPTLRFDAWRITLGRIGVALGCVLSAACGGGGGDIPAARR